MSDWLSDTPRAAESRAQQADLLFRQITLDWERKRPVWVLLMLNSLTESDVKTRGIPVLDLYLAQEAERKNKYTGAVESVNEQCAPLNRLNLNQVSLLGTESWWFVFYIFYLMLNYLRKMWNQSNVFYLERKGNSLDFLKSGLYCNSYILKWLHCGSNCML